MHVWKGHELDWSFHRNGPLDFCSDCSLDLIEFLLEFQKKPTEVDRTITLKARTLKQLGGPAKQLKGKGD